MLFFGVRFQCASSALHEHWPAHWKWPEPFESHTYHINHQHVFKLKIQTRIHVHFFCVAITTNGTIRSHTQTRNPNRMWHLKPVKISASLVCYLIMNTSCRSAIHRFIHSIVHRIWDTRKALPFDFMQFYHNYSLRVSHSTRSDQWDYCARFNQKATNTK